VLNSTFEENNSTLRALPKIASTLSLIKTLQLTNLPLGIPIGLLTFAEYRLLSIIRAVAEGSRARPSVIIIEEPLAGLSMAQQSALITLMNDAQQSQGATWIAVTRDTRFCDPQAGSPVAL
jgi:ABC-type antimicrobial peptide transport system ATPase subunit